MMGQISDHYRVLSYTIHNEIGSLHQADLSGTTVEQWISYFLNKYGFKPIQLLASLPLLQSRVDKVEKDVRGRTYMVEEDVAVVGLPVEENHHIHQLLRMKADTWYQIEPQWESQYSTVLGRGGKVGAAVAG